MPVKAGEESFNKTLEDVALIEFGIDADRVACASDEDEYIFEEVKGYIEGALREIYNERNHGFMCPENAHCKPVIVNCQVNGIVDGYHRIKLWFWGNPNEPIESMESKGSIIYIYRNNRFRAIIEYDF